MKSYTKNKSNLANTGNDFGDGVCTSIAIMYLVTVCYAPYIVQL